MKITSSHLKRLATGAKAVVVDAIVETAPTVLPKYGITTPRRMQHFFSQLAHESGGFKLYEENLNYSAKRLTQVWPKRFPTLAHAQPYANNPRKLANKVYGGRMGNQPGTNDGYDYRGRGLIQITGRDGYRKVGLEDDPDQAALPENFLEVAGRFWKWKNLNALADSNDLNEVTRRINGGLNGLADRKEYLAKARRIFTENLSDDEEVEPAEEADDAADSSKPDMSDAGVGAPLAPPTAPKVPASAAGDSRVDNVQKSLAKMNYASGVNDGLWGSMTAGAITAFVVDRNMDIAPPTTFEQFVASYEQLQSEIGVALTEEFKRPVSAARADASGSGLLAMQAPESVPTRRNFLVTAWGAVCAFFAAVWDTVSGYFQTAWGWFSEHKDTVPTDKVASWFGKVPLGVWFALIAGVLGFVAFNAFRAQKEISKSITTGQRA